MSSNQDLARAAVEKFDMSTLIEFIKYLATAGSGAGALKIYDWLKSRRKDGAEASKIEAEAQVTLADAWKIYADKQETRADAMAKSVLEMAIKIEALETINRQLDEKILHFEAQIDALQSLMRKKAAELSPPTETKSA